MNETTKKDFVNNIDVLKYDKRMGRISYPEGFFDKIKGLSLEDQMDYFRMTYKNHMIHTGWSERVAKQMIALSESEDVLAIIVNDSYIVGVLVFDAWNNLRALMIEGHITISYSSDNNGAGYKESSEYLYLVCVDKDTAVEDDK